MVTPLVSIKKTIHNAESNISSTLSTASRLREEINDSNKNHSTNGLRPEELDSEDARDRVEDIYEPLMSNRDRVDRSDEDDEDDVENGNQHYVSSDREDLKERKVHKLEVGISYTIFLILGACVLLPWNTEIVAGTYIRSRLEGSSLQNSFSSWVALTFTTGNLVFLAIANATQLKANLAHRIFLSIFLIIITLTLFTISTTLSTIPPLGFFAFLMISTILLAAASSYLQNAVVALSSKFGPMYLQGILSGQGAVGLAVASVQFVTAIGSIEGDEGSLMDIPKGIRNSAFSFFLAVAIFSIFSLIAHFILTRLPLYRLIIQSSQKSTHHHSHPSSPPSFKKVEKKVRHYGISIFLIFLITLSVFPSITSSILSVNEGTSGGLGEKWTNANLFIPMGFVIFSAGDWIGRALPGLEKMRFSNKNWLRWISIGRIGFVPLFLMCNVQAGGTSSSQGFIQSDTIFLLLMLIFSITNGYISTLIMLSAIVDPILKSEEVDIAATCLAFYLTAGLAAGSLISFPVRAVVCRCNPFV